LLELIVSSFGLFQYWQMTGSGNDGKACAANEVTHHLVPLERAKGIVFTAKDQRWHADRADVAPAGSFVLSGLQQNLLPDCNVIDQRCFPTQAPRPELGMADAHDMNFGSGRRTVSAPAIMPPSQ
jgi:hypothetical protein